MLYSFLQLEGATKLDFGTKLKLARGKKSQVEIAEKLSISVNTLRSYENNRGMPSIDSFKEICQRLDLSADKILEIDDVSSTPSNKGGFLNQKLANIRDNSDLTIEEMASLFEVSASTWTKYENGSRTPPLKRLQKICKTCKVSANYLLGIDK